MNPTDTYDVIVVGGGHAGCEAALAAARMGARVALLTARRDAIAEMSCNPAIGGLAKGHLVREIDALGGEMARVTDRTAIQFRMLNMSKGPAVWAPRAQCDRKAYREAMRAVVEAQPGLDVIEEMTIELLVEGARVRGVFGASGRTVLGAATILATGTFLNGLIHVGEKSWPAGRYGEDPALGLSEGLAALGFRLGRLKTGTPPRLDGRTVDWAACEFQPGDDPPGRFARIEPPQRLRQVPCHITYTTSRTADIIRANLDRSPLYAGRIVGVGPRYCPSIEDKVVRFPHRERHQLFLEPEGLDTDEIYANGIPTSLPEDVQLALVHSIPGLESAELTRYGYAIEYDFVPPDQVKRSLETKLVENLFLAGQINGTSGYEEAAAQGLMAGINAVLKLRGEEAVVLGRDEAYIGVLIDDLCTKEIREPYRMFTSRAEFRLLLRQDNADARLLPIGHRLGLISDAEHDAHARREGAIAGEIERLHAVRAGGEPLALLLKRPGTTYAGLRAQHPALVNAYDTEVERRIELEIKYEGYLDKQRRQVEQLAKTERRRIPPDVEFRAVRGLRAEAAEKLAAVRPDTFGQASRIAGINPADLAVLAVYLARREKPQTPQISTDRT
ncbi:MAG: tRNA uridine-5-carboxymethylaminomethyl(34) synthesis enzyme MnmG [Verrucomicrobia bacterium]|nr:tRNA uridine-5-carboxymethylaminomethyl(34) synthesis enzyme MnmG [Verrucomicrobiota bacterium]